MIPKTIHYCWFGGNELSDKAKKCIESWKKFAPEYDIKEWNESNYDYKKNKFMENAYNAGKWSFLTDYARLDIIYNNGGIYMDTDVELIKPIDELLNAKAYFGFETDSTINTGLGFGAESGIEVLKEMMDVYDELPIIKEDEYSNYVCPGIQTPVLERIGLKLNGTRQNIDGIEIYPKIYFCPLNYDTGRLLKDERSYSIHWFDGSWKSSLEKHVMQMKQRLTPYLGNKNAWRIAVLVQYMKYLGPKKTFEYYADKIKEIS